MQLKVFADRRSQPSRAIIIFCRVNGIDFEEVKVDIGKFENKTPDFLKINPMGQVPAILDGKFRLFESHAILRYLACVFPGVPDHWYPADLFTRAKIDSVLDWHHLNLRRGATTMVFNSALAPTFGLPLNLKAAAGGEKLLRSSLKVLESVWLKGDAKFLVGSSRPSIADLSLACELTQLEVLDDNVHESLLGPHERVRDWISNVKKATSPHFEEVHQAIYKVKEYLRKKAASEANQETGLNTGSKMPSKL